MQMIVSGERITFNGSEGADHESVGTAGCGGGGGGGGHRQAH